jgi:hypothetical protein
LEGEFGQLEDAKLLLPIADVELTDDPAKIEPKLFQGNVLLTVKGDSKKYCFFSAKKGITRNINQPEVEFTVVGPKEAFVESLEQNINLVRKRIPIKELIVENVKVGNLSKTNIAILHIEGITNIENVNTVRQRIKEIEFDELIDSSYVTQIISDNKFSPFPQMLDTERPDRVAAVLAEGKVVVMVDGSPHALIAPTTLVDFFSSFEDYFFNWLLASFARLIRLFGVTFSIMVTPLYVATLTYHYELIPQDLLGPLIASRRAVPFPPILEALFLETTIELLREAGARLPTKVGQTIGIVGGIVIGTASVEAGLTSNVLLIMIGLAALASFTTPVYRMGNTIRLMRFPFLFMADLWGLLGLTVCFSLILTHLIRLTSLGRPILEPFFPFRLQDLKDALIKFPISKRVKRPFFLQTAQPYRYDPDAPKVKKDIDE